MKLCGVDIGLDKPFFLIAGPCVIESRQLAIDTAGALKEMTGALGIPFIYKSSYDKANRSSSSSFRGLGMEKGLDILADVKKQFRSRRCLADTGVFVQADRLHPGMRPQRQTRQHQKRTVSRPRRHDQCRQKST